jgi:hypothetical protein
MVDAELGVTIVFNGLHLQPPASCAASSSARDIGCSPALRFASTLPALLAGGGVNSYELLAGVMRAAAPPACRDPSLVVLTDGADNVAYYEHAQAARHLGAALATPADLVRAGDRLRMRLAFAGDDAGTPNANGRPRRAARRGWSRSSCGNR